MRKLTIMILCAVFVFAYVSDAKADKLGTGFDGNIQQFNLTTKSEITAEEINGWFVAHDSQTLASSGKYFKDAEREYGINAIFMVSLASLESGYGNSEYAVQRNNFFGWGANTENPDNAKDFATVEEAIKTVSKGIKENYLTPGGDFFDGKYTLSAVNDPYCTNAEWALELGNIMIDINDGKGYNGVIGAEADTKTESTNLVNKQSYSNPSSSIGIYGVQPSGQYILSYNTYVTVGAIIRAVNEFVLYASIMFVFMIVVLWALMISAIIGVPFLSNVAVRLLPDYINPRENNQEISNMVKTTLIVMLLLGVTTSGQMANILITIIEIADKSIAGLI